MNRLGTSLLIINDTEQILLFLRDDKPEIPYPNMWDIPGGHVEANETPEQCIVREMKEEMDLDLTISELFLITEFPDRIEHTFWCRMNLNIDEIRLMEGQRLRWFTEAEAAATELACGFNQVVAMFFEKRSWCADQ